jgi:hypothetical protein
VTDGRAHLVVCLEHFSDGHCLRPATFIVGDGVVDGLPAGYPACNGCALFWEASRRYKLTESDHRLFEIAAAWANVPVSEHPSKLAAVAHQGYRRHAA